MRRLATDCGIRFGGGAPRVKLPRSATLTKTRQAPTAGPCDQILCQNSMEKSVRVFDRDGSPGPRELAIMLTSPGSHAAPRRRPPRSDWRRGPVTASTSQPTSLARRRHRPGRHRLRFRPHPLHHRRRLHATDAAALSSSNPALPGAARRVRPRHRHRGRTVAFQADERFAFCSTIKAFAAGKLLRRESDAQLRAERITYSASGPSLDYSPVTIAARAQRNGA